MTISPFRQFWRDRGRFVWPEIVAFVVYCCVLAFAILHHEPWGDEAQAWLLARDSSLPELFLKRLHYEGTAGLWHLLLWIEVRLGVSYAGMHWITGALFAAAVFLLLRFAPFQHPLKLAMPFTSALLFQGPVVTRSYTLIFVFVVLLCVVRRAEQPRPVLFVVLAGLLANTSALGALIALGFLAEFLLPGPDRMWGPSSGFIVRATVWSVVLWGMCIYTALPALDAHFPFLASVRTHPPVVRILQTLTSSKLPPPVSNVAADQPAPAEDVPVKANRMPHSAVQSAVLAAMFPDHVTFKTHLLRNLVLMCSYALYVISPWGVVGVAFYLTLLLWLVHYHALRYALPLMLITTLGVKLYISAHHLMVWWFAIVGLLWLAWPRQQKAGRSWIDITFQVALGFVIVQQIAFGLYAVHFDAVRAFDPGKETARFLASRRDGVSVESFSFFAVSSQPYFGRNLYSNQRTTFWPWSTKPDPQNEIAFVSTSKPQIVILGETFSGDDREENEIVPQSPAGVALIPSQASHRLQAMGYVETHRFCGEQPIHFGYYEQVCNMIYERSDAAHQNERTR